jgi:hypothetical protein
VAQAAAEHNTQQATYQTEQKREPLRAQLGQVLQTQEMARGLIVNMSEVLFNTTKYTLKPEAREKLSKVSGFLLAYPKLKQQVEATRTRLVGPIQLDAFATARRCGSHLPRFPSRQRGQRHCDRLRQQPLADNATAAGGRRTAEYRWLSLFGKQPASRIPRSQERRSQSQTTKYPGVSLAA